MVLNILIIPFFSFSRVQLGPVIIYTWGFFVALGILFALFYSLKLAKKKNIDTNIIVDAFFWLLIGLIIGGRLGHVFQNFSYYSQNLTDILKIWKGGMAFHGGLIGLLLAGIIFAWIKKIEKDLFFKIADSIALVAPLGIAIGRIGCSLINDHQGIQTNLPWGIIWPDGIVRHPVAEYLIIANILIFLILKYFWKKNRFSGFLLLCSISRFLLDFTRSTGTSLSDPRYGGLSTAQWLSLAVILGIITKSLMFLIKKKKTAFLILLLAFLILSGASCQKEDAKILSDEEIKAILLEAGKDLGWGGAKVEYSKLGYFIEITGKENSFKTKLQIYNLTDFSKTSDKDNYLKELCKFSEDSSYKSQITEISETKICYIKKSYQEDYIFDNIANAIVGNYQLIAQSRHDRGEAIDAREIIVPLIKKTKVALLKKIKY